MSLLDSSRLVKDSFFTIIVTETAGHRDKRITTERRCGCSPQQLQRTCRSVPLLTCSPVFTNLQPVVPKLLQKDRSGDQHHQRDHCSAHSRGRSRKAESLPASTATEFRPDNSTGRGQRLCCVRLKDLQQQPSHAPASRIPTAARFDKSSSRLLRPLALLSVSDNTTNERQEQDEWIRIGWVVKGLARLSASIAGTVSAATIPTNIPQKYP